MNTISLKNAWTTFQRIMDKLLLRIQNERYLVYMDDIIYSPIIHEHISCLKDYLKRLRNSNLKIQQDMSEFLPKEVTYLGHLVTEDEVEPNPAKNVLKILLISNNY